MRLPSVMKDLRLRGERVNVKVPEEDDMHTSCILKIRDRIRAKEDRNAVRRR